MQVDFAAHQFVLVSSFCSQQAQCFDERWCRPRIQKCNVELALVDLAESDERTSPDNPAQFRGSSDDNGDREAKGFLNGRYDHLPDAGWIVAARTKDDVAALDVGRYVGEADRLIQSLQS